MSKGADSAILARLVKPEKLESSPDDASYLPAPAPAPSPPPPPPPPFSLQPTRQMAGGTNSSNNSTGSGSVFGTLPGIPPAHPHSLSTRRKPSQPSPAYLQQHSRTSSVASSSMPATPAAAAAGDSQPPAQKPGADLALSSLPPRFSDSFMIHGGES
ncbi:hypothetical protein EV177_011056, partial [Coemansia sp. RSA 1804]